MFTEIERSVEKHFGGDRKKLGSTGSGVVAQNRRAFCSNRVVGGGAHIDPALLRIDVIEWRRAVNGAIEHVESVGKLVVHDVLAPIGKLGPVTRCRP